MKSMGFFKKDALAEELRKTPIETKSVNEPTSSYFTSPSNKKYSVTKETDFLISGNAPDGVTGVYINDYKLKTFSAKEKKFYYRAKLDIGTIKNGANTYSLAFEIDGKKVQKETIEIFLATTDEEAALKEQEYGAKLKNEQALLVSQEAKKTEEDKSLISKMAPLDGTYYYNRDLKKFSLAFVYTKQVPYMEKLAAEIADHLKKLGIDVQTTVLSTDDLQTIISKGEKQYAMILTGINL